MNTEFIETYARILWASHGFEDAWRDIYNPKNEQHIAEAQKLWDLARGARSNIENQSNK